MELEKLLEKVEKIQEGNTPEETAKELEQQSKEQQQNDGLETNNNQGDGDKSQNQNSEENKEQPADNGNGQPEFFKDFEGKAQVSPDDIKTILSDPTKGQQLIDWAKTQNAIVKEVPGLQNTMKTAQANGNNQNGGDQAANDGNNQNDGNQANGNTAQNGGNQAAPQRPFTDYLEPLGKIMKTQADCDKAIEFFTNLKNTKPAAAEGGNEAPQTNPAN